MQERALLRKIYKFPPLSFKSLTTCNCQWLMKTRCFCVGQAHLLPVLGERSCGTVAMRNRITTPGPGPFLKRWLRPLPDFISSNSPLHCLPWSSHGSGAFTSDFCISWILHDFSKETSAHEHGIWVLEKARGPLLVMDNHQRVKLSPLSGHQQGALKWRLECQGQISPGTSDFVLPFHCTFPCRVLWNHLHTGFATGWHGEA